MHSSKAGSWSSSIVAGRSSTTVVWSPAEKMVLPRGAMQSAVCLSAGVKDNWRRVPA